MRPSRLVSMGHGVRLARSPRRPEPAVHAYRRARDAGPARELVARGMPGCAVLAPAAAARLLGLRRPAARRNARRQLERRRRPDDRLQAPLPGARSRSGACGRSTAYGANDERSLAADNTAAFNCRYAVGPGPRRWSVHAYGLAIDVNPVENPYLESGRVHPPRGQRVPRPLERPAGHGGARRAARPRVRLGRLAVGRPLDRARPTTSTSRRPAASAPRRTADAWRAAPRGRSSASASGRRADPAEQARAAAEQHRRDVERDVVDDARAGGLLGGLGAAGD